MLKLLLLFLLFGWIGCKSTSSIDVEPFEYRFEKTLEKPVETKSSKLVTIRFDGVPFGQAMGILSQETGSPIVWSSPLDEMLVYGHFSAVTLPSVLTVLARRAGASFTELGGVFYVGETKKDDRAFAVLRIPPVDQTQLIASVKQSCTQDAAVSVLGSCLWICDTMESLRKVVSALETIRERNERSYIAEIYFIRVNEDTFVNLTADLQIKQIDIFSSSFNIDELFQMFVNADGGTGFATVSQRPVLYLSEGQPVTFTDGKEITREQKTLTETGAVQTTGYQKFSDGTQLTMTLNRASEKTYMIDMDLSVSVFDKNDKNDVPATDKSRLTAKGLQVRDSSVYYVGSLRRDNYGKSGGLFSFDFTKSHDMITIWLRVRELKGSLQ